jgi:fructose-bisphosphate aldolase / 2-amino-3,7-dideoxy-D-threo-hept-6-ulosonate synthase
MDRSDGHFRAMARLLPADAPAVWHPVDDALIAGPDGLLRDPRELLTQEVVTQLDAVLGFEGTLSRCRDQLVLTPLVVNLTASTLMGDHTRKVPIMSVADALRLGATAVACHLNFSAPSETEMIRGFASVVAEARRFGLPVVAITYPRGVREDGSDDNYFDLRAADPDSFARKVAHAVRAAAELGASVIKTVYTGTAESFQRVVDGACGVPVLIAGEEYAETPDVLYRAEAALQVGARGVAFGRQIFERKDPASFLCELRDRLTVAYTKCNRGDHSPTT